MRVVIVGVNAILNVEDILVTSVWRIFENYNSFPTSDMVTMQRYFF